MAVIKTTNPKVSTLKQGIKYITNPEKAELITGKDCTAETALNEMQATKALYNKNEGRQYMHFVQSFKPDDPLDPSQAHQIGLEMAEERFKGYEVLVATHTDKDHLHNHLIVNSVSFETGAKFQHSKNELQAMKDLSDQICEREGLYVIKEKIPGRDLSMNEYQMAIKGQSWKIKTSNDIDKTLETCHDKKTFIAGMENKGYQVKWLDERKYITYTTPEGNKVRDNKLHDEKYSKEGMENEFSRVKENQPDHGRTTNEKLRDYLVNSRQRELDSSRRNQGTRSNIEKGEQRSAANSSSLPDFYGTTTSNDKGNPDYQDSNLARKIQNVWNEPSNQPRGNSTSIRSDASNRALNGIFKTLEKTFGLEKAEKQQHERKEANKHEHVHERER